MLKKLFPQRTENSIYDIDYSSLFEKGIKFLIFDLDNTVAPYDVPEPDEKMTAFFTVLKQKGFALCFLSNNEGARVERFNRTLGLFAVSKARKPKTSGVNRALTLMGGSASQTAIVGDQLLTDIWCGNRAGIMTIHVKPVADRDEWTVRLKRPIERLIFKRYKKFARKKKP